jgi:hypothetical protein
MKFAIVTHVKYKETDGGLNCLLTLAKALYDRGHDARVYIPPIYRCEEDKANTIFARYIELDEMEPDRIAVYIDITIGNPLNAKRIVRWLSYGSHYYDSYDKNEIVYYYGPFCKNNKTTKILTPIHWPGGMENKGLPRMRTLCHVIRKGWGDLSIQHIVNTIGIPAIPGVPVKDSLDVRWHSHQELIDTFNTTKYFYCYDPCSFLVVIAIACGCIVIQHPIYGCTAEEWKYTFGLQGLNGIAYGAENVAHGEATIADAPNDIAKLKKRCEDSIDSFIRDLETGNYTYEPCYKFNDSPYALQHVTSRFH